MSQKEKSQTGSTEAHQKLVHEILLTLGALPHIRIWKNQTGKARSIDGKRIISFGLKGSADIIGIIKPGKFLAIEVKSGQAKQSKEQIAFAKMVTNMGGVYILARELSDISHLMVS